MEIRQIQYFTAIVREGSFSAAARRLHIGQPALSKQIQALERELGVDLLIRAPEGVRPTASGARLDEMSRTLLGYLDDIRSEVRGSAASLSGTVTLGLSPSLIPALAGYLEERLAADHPGVRIRIVEALPMFLAEWLEGGRLDLGVFTRADYRTTRISFTDVGSDEMLLVAAGELLSGVGGPATPDTLRSLRLALTPGFREVLRTSLDLDRMTDGIGSGIDSLHLVRDLVVRGEYCSVLPYTFVRDDLDSGVLTAIGFAPVLKRELVAVTRAGRHPSPAAEAVTEMVRIRLGELAADRRAASAAVQLASSASTISIDSSQERETSSGRNSA
ncbi:LysR substrate-binding domain-containing protein [Amycolatopsis ultiminotia]|uniref:LysR substrate-binding domain-containing protein n=2 Tax=Amycolatopsis ultiminotia TaxID=543629 RepID=A0ABP6VGV6_9PSEU